MSVYTWTIIEDSTDTEKSNLVQVIQTAYSWSDLASDTMYADILSRTSTWEMVDFVDVVVLGRTNYSSNTTNEDTWIGWNDEYTKLLLHWENMLDSSNLNSTVTAYWDTQITTSWKFNSWIHFDWAWDYLDISSSDDLDLSWSDFTIDFWVKFNSIKNNVGFVSNTDQNASDSGYWTFTYNWNIYFASTTWIGSWNSCNINIPWNPIINNYYHIAYVYYLGKMHIYIDWYELTNGLCTVMTSSLDLIIGKLLGSIDTTIDGYIDEVRISKWIARWTENFTPPSEPYSE